MIVPASRSLLVGLPLVVGVLDFVILWVTYLLLAPIAPGVLGEVADSPARFAAWITLVKLPMTVAHMLAASWRGWAAASRPAEVPEPPAQGRLAKIRDWAVDIALTVAAALIVFTLVADPGAAHLWQLVAVTAAGPFLLPKAVSGLARLLRRRTRPAEPADA